MEFFKKRGTAWVTFALVVVCSFFIGKARQPADHIEILPSGVYVQDNADILSASTEEYITHLNNGLVSKAGGEIQVVTINTVGGQNIFDVAIDHGMNTNLSSNSCVFWWQWMMWTLLLYRAKNCCMLSRMMNCPIFCSPILMKLISETVISTDL